MLATLKICVRCFVCWNIKAEAKGGLIRQRRAKVKAARRIKTTVRTQIPKVSLSMNADTSKAVNKRSYILYIILYTLIVKKTFAKVKMKYYISSVINYIIIL